MRLAGRFSNGTREACSVTTLGFLLTLSACSLPDVTVEKKQARADAGGMGFFSKRDDHSAATVSSGDKTYLATVHIQFTEAGAPVTFDVRRDRRDLISANLVETEETSTYLHLGLSHDEGGTAGLRFTWKF